MGTWRVSGARMSVIEMDGGSSLVATESNVQVFSSVSSVLGGWEGA